MPDVNIKILTTNDDKGVKNAVGSFTELNSAIGIASKVMQVAKKAYDETIGVTMKYAAEVRDLSLATGAGAEESSRFLQVMDDFQVSASDVTAGMRAMKEKGLVPTIDTLAQLSDQFLAIEDPAKRLQFAQDNLGRSSAKYLNVLSKGGDAIRKMSDGVEENLILTDEQIAKTEEYRLKMDALSDSFMGFKVQAGLAMFATGDAIDEVGNKLADMREEGERASVWSAAYAVHLENNTAAANDLSGKIQDDLIPALNGITEATIEASAANTELLGLTMSLQSETDRYKETQTELNAQMTDLIKQQAAGTISSDEYAAQMGELTGAVKANQAAHVEAGNKIAFSLLQQKLAVEGLRDDEFAFLLDVGVQWGILDQTTANTARIMDEQLGAISDSFKDPISKMTQANEKLHALQNMAGQTWTYYVDIVTSGRFPNMPNQNQSGPGTNAGVGYQSGFATGGSFVIPPQYGYEGFGMGGIATASAGELVTISPKGGGGGGTQQVMITNWNGFNYAELAAHIIKAQNSV